MWRLQTLKIQLYNVLLSLSECILSPSCKSKVFYSAPPLLHALFYHFSLTTHQHLDKEQMENEEWGQWRPSGTVFKGEYLAWGQILRLNSTKRQTEQTVLLQTELMAQSSSAGKLGIKVEWLQALFWWSVFSPCLCGFSRVLLLRADPALARCQLGLAAAPQPPCMSISSYG